jgi:cytosylglucuronate decarboxylase
VGPHNYVEIPELQRVLTRLGVQQWELSSLKLEREMVYSSPEHVLEVCDPVYAADHGELLVPLGKRFYGDTPLEREVYFTTGNTPRASLPLCHVTDDVIYLDGKYGRSYACSCLPHRSDGGAPTREGGDLELDTRQFQEHADHYRIQGPRLCTGCSTTAAGYSDDVERLGSALLWSY